MAGAVDAALDGSFVVVAAAAVAVAVAAGQVACLGSVGNLQLRDSWRLQRSLVTIYNSRNAKTPLTGRAYLLSQRESAKTIEHGDKISTPKSFHLFLGLFVLLV